MYIALDDVKRILTEGRIVFAVEIALLKSSSSAGVCFEILHGVNLLVPFRGAAIGRCTSTVDTPGRAKRSIGNHTVVH